MARVLLITLLLALATLATMAAPADNTQLDIEDNQLQPLAQEGVESEAQVRDKRKLEGVTQAKFGVKNAILGFVFGKINSIIDAKTRLVETLDRQNIEKNKQYGIEAPSNGLASLSGVVSGVIGPKLQLLGPKIQLVSGLFGGSSGGGSAAGGSGSGLGSLLSLVTSLSGGSSGGGLGGAAGATVETVDSSEEDDS